MSEQESPAEAQREATNRRNELANSVAETGANVVETAESPGADGRPHLELPPLVRGASGAASFLANTAQFMGHVDAAAEGPPGDRTTNLMRSAGDGSSALGALARVGEVLGAGGRMARVATRASRAGALLQTGANVVDLTQHGPTLENMNGIRDGLVSTLPPQLQLAAQAGVAAGTVALGAANQTALDDHMHPQQQRQRDGRTVTVDETGTDAASRNGVETQRSMAANHPIISRALGRLVRPDRMFSRMSDAEMIDSGSTAAGAVRAMGSAVANGASDWSAAATNAAYRAPSPRDRAAARALGVEPLSPARINRLPELVPAPQ